VTTAVAAALVIPAWDEAESIAAVLAEVPPACVQRVFVVVPAVDDPTASVARAWGANVLVQDRRGYGAACWTGAQAALAHGADIIAFLDGDYADPPAELPRVLGPLLAGQADLVLGCRDISRYPGALPLHARAGNALVAQLVRMLVGKAFADLPSFKAISARTLVDLDMREMTYGWTVEMLVKAGRASVRVAEVPVEYRPRLGGRSKVAGDARASVRAAWKLIGCAIAYASWRPARMPAAPVLSGH
jgi:glycosyltransferase involved in cell wall biosynthesis